MFVSSIGVVLWAVLYTSTQYLSIRSRFEDYYFLLTVVCVLAFYIGEVIIVLMDRMILDLVILCQYHLTWAYWFLTIYLFQLIPVRNIKIRRLVRVILTVLVVFGTAHTMGAGNPRYLKPEIVNSDMMLLMKMDYAIDDRFLISIQFVKLAIVLAGMICSWRIGRKPSWMFYAMGFLFASVTLTLVNATLVRPEPSRLLFDLKQGLILLTCVFTSIGARQYFHRRILK